MEGAHAYGAPPADAFQLEDLEDEEEEVRPALPTLTSHTLPNGHWQMPRDYRLLSEMGHACSVGLLMGIWVGKRLGYLHMYESTEFLKSFSVILQWLQIYILLEASRRVLLSTQSGIRIHIVVSSFALSKVAL